jgi:hypothetical protein
MTMATPFTFEARHSSTCEGERAAVHPNRKRSATANSPLANLYWTAPPMPGSPWRTNVHQTGPSCLAGQNVAFCNAAKFTKWPLLKGQWRFVRLLCIGAAGNKVRGGCSLSPKK